MTAAIGNGETMREWYRNRTWNAGIRDAFFAKLKGARSQRDQYIVIQALELAATEPEAALELVDHYFETRKNDFHDLRALLARTRALMTAGRLEEAASAYRDTIDLEARNPNLKVGAALDFAVFVVEHGIDAAFDEAEALLPPQPDLFLMPREGFRYHACRALIAERAGDRGDYDRHRTAAVLEARRTVSALPGHPRLGLVGAEEAPLALRLGVTLDGEHSR